MKVKARLLSKLINVFTYFFTTLIVFRFILRLLGANSKAPFAAWLYATTDDLIYSFQGIFPDVRIAGSSVVDLSALFAGVVIFVLGYFAGVLVDNLSQNVRISGLKHTVKEASDYIVEPKNQGGSRSASAPKSNYTPPVPPMNGGPVRDESVDDLK